MFHLIQLIVMVLAFISHDHEAVATLWQPTLESYPPLIAPITKHSGAAQDLYSVEIMTDWVNGQYVHSDFLIDTDARLVWHECIVQLPISTEKCPIDTLCNTYVPSPPCNVENPVTGGCLQVKTSYDEFTVNLSNGRHILAGVYGASLITGCAPSSAMVSFPKNVTGVMALSRSPYAYPAHLTGIRKNILALCLPSTTSARGVLLFGESPFYLLPHSDVDVTSLLSYTPLYTHPESFGYFIVVNAIVIKKRSTGL
ncbi:putative aspartic peptidase A1 family protein, partial [Tanacetum coccineum]